MNGLPTGIVFEGYARLPEDLLHDMLEGSGSMVEEVERILGTNLERQADLRAGLLSLGWLRVLEETDTGTVSGIDGGYAVERTSSVDLSLAVAVGVEGLSDATSHWGGTQYEWWTRVGRHDIEPERLCRGVMIAQELAILRGAPHTYRILDGSHLTPVIQLNSSLTVGSTELADEAVRVWERLETVEALAVMSSDRHIVAMPKYDSSRFIAERLQTHVGFQVPGDD